MLFRIEVLEQKSTQALGPVLISQKGLTRIFTYLSSLIAMLVVVFIFSFEHTKRAKVSGISVSEAGPGKITAPISGVLIQRRVDEGSHVGKGEIVASISAERASETSPQVFASISEQVRERIARLRQERDSQTSILEIQRKSLEGRLKAIRLEISQLAVESELQMRRVSLTQKNVDRFRELAKTQFVSSVQAQQREEELLDQEAKLQALSRTKSSLEREAMNTSSELEQWNAKVLLQISTIDRGILSAEQELSETESRRQIEVIAQQSGKVTGMLVEAGQTVTAGQLLMSVSTDGSRLQAHLFVTGRSIGFIQAGQPVLLRFHAFPYQKFGHQEGRVRHVSLTAISPQELPPVIQGTFQSNDPVFRVVVDLASQHVLAYGEKMPIQAGMQMEADVLLDRRSLIEWILEPLYSIKGKL